MCPQGSHTGGFSPGSDCVLPWTRLLQTLAHVSGFGSILLQAQLNS